MGGVDFVHPSLVQMVFIGADGRDHQPLDVKEGPLSIVIPGDKKMARWVCQVTALPLGLPGANMAWWAAEGLPTRPISATN